MNTQDKNNSNTTQPCTRGNHAAIHEDIHLARTRISSESPDELPNEKNETTVYNEIVVTAGRGHAGYH